MLFYCYLKYLFSICIFILCSKCTIKSASHIESISAQSHRPDYNWVHCKYCHILYLQTITVGYKLLLIDFGGAQSYSEISSHLCSVLSGLS